MEPGDVWAYRARSIDALAPVRVVRLGKKKPARVLVRWEDMDEEGREEWVPPARLKVLWERVDEFRAQEARWAAIYAEGPGGDTAEAYAANEVISLYLDHDIASISSSSTSYLMIREVAALAERTGLPVNVLDHPLAFDADGGYVVPWPVTKLVARSIAERHADMILAEVDKEEREAQRAMIHGGSYERSRGNWRATEAEWEIEKDAMEWARPRREVLRAWCGEHAKRWDELAELRKEIKRVGDIAERAIDALRATGAERPADDLMIALGKTVEMLRTDSRT